MLSLLAASSLILAAASYAFLLATKALEENVRLQYARVYCHTHFKHSV
jgi:hypothetical protein